MGDSNACDESQLSIWLNLMELGEYSANVARECRQYFNAGKTKRFTFIFIFVPRHIQSFAFATIESLFSVLGESYEANVVLGI